MDQANVAQPGYMHNNTVETYSFVTLNLVAKQSR